MQISTLQKGITCSILLYTSFQLSATNYYESYSGSSSGNGSISSPYDFATGLTKLIAGDTLFCRGGTYSFSTRQSISKSGTSGNLIHVVAYPGEVPIFDFHTMAYNSSNQGVLLSGSYFHFKGIIVEGAGDNGMQVTGSYNVIENCKFRWNCDAGLQMKTGSNNYILNCDSYENFDYETTSSGSPNYGGNADGFADKQYTNTGTNTYEGCRSWSNSDDGWDHYQAVSNTIYKNCWCYNNGPASFDMTNHIRYTTDKTYIDGFTNHIITNYGNGNGFKLGGAYTVHNATLTNCISVSNKVKGFDQNNNDGTMTIYNCSSYNNGINYGFTNNSYGTLIIKNCTSLSSKSSNSLNCKSVTSAYNTWNTGFSCSTSDFLNLDATLMLNDRNADGSLPTITLLHLASGSALIDKGTDVGLSYSGTAPDLGAYEYSVTTGIENVSLNCKVSYFPNPVKDKLHIRFESSTDGIINIRIVNTLGQTLIYQKADASDGTNEFTIDCSFLPSGLYSFCLQGSGLNSVLKILK